MFFYRISIIKEQVKLFKGVFPLGNIEIEQIRFGKYGDCLKLSNDKTELIATVEIGPRIIKFGKKDGPNEFFEDTEDKSKEMANDLLEYYGNNKGGWHIYGGHRLWVAPESFPETYYPDNRKVDYEIIDNGFVLKQEPQIENGIQNKIKIEMSKEGIVDVSHYITNISKKVKELAPWSLSVMAVGGLMVIPVNKRNSGLLHNMNISVWHYTDLNDDRLDFGTDYIKIKSTKETSRNFKLGVSVESGYVLYFNNNNMFVKRFEEFKDKNKYPDNNVNFEAYTCNSYTEIETLGKLIKLKPDDTVCHKEAWQLVTDIAEPSTDKEISNIIETFIK